MKQFLLTILLVSQSAFAYDALVWGGPGACKEDCVTAAVHATKLAGFDPMIVTPENFDASLFESAKVWVTPGGKSASVSIALGATNREIIKKFVFNGGGYVGFCAGGFLVTHKVGTSKYAGLGIVDGNSSVYRKSPGNVSLQELTTPTGTKFHYWEGGPYFSFSETQFKKITVTSRYKKTNQINGLETTYGAGRVAVTGTHPEAPQWWYDDGHISDIDGLDNEEAAAMIKWAAKN
jgi:glutamine amidotransferase-like uncharacterized protein